jgi:hypothetical protein
LSGGLHGVQHAMACETCARVAPETRWTPGARRARRGGRRAAVRVPSASASSSPAARSGSRRRRRVARSRSAAATSTSGWTATVPEPTAESPETTGRAERRRKRRRNRRPLSPDRSRGRRQPREAAAPEPVNERCELRGRAGNRRSQRHERGVRVLCPALHAHVACLRCMRRWADSLICSRIEVSERRAGQRTSGQTRCRSHRKDSLPHRCFSFQPIWATAVVGGNTILHLRARLEDVSCPGLVARGRPYSRNEGPRLGGATELRRASRTALARPRNSAQPGGVEATAY